jgi:hypothetical protein
MVFMLLIAIAIFKTISSNLSVSDNLVEVFQKVGAGKKYFWEKT